MAAAVRIAPAARGARQVEHAGGQHFVFRPAHARIEASQADQRLQGGTGGDATQHQTVELRPRRVVVQRLEIGMRDAVDEQVGVVRRQADHRQHFTGARVHRHRRTFLVTEGGHQRALQVGIDGQAQVGAGLRGHPADGTDGAALHVGLDLLVADLAAQLLLVIALQARLADVGQRRVALTEDLQVLVVHAADVADDVREQVAVGVAAGQVGFQLHAGETPAVHGEARHFLIGHAQLEGDRQELAARLARLVERFQLFRADADDLRQPVQGGVHVLDLVRGHIQAEGRHVLGQQAAVAVVDHAAPGHDRPRLDAVGLRARGVDVVVQHLQLEVPAAQAQQADQHAEEAQRQPQLQAHIAGHRAVEVQPLHHVAQAHVRRALEAAGLTLLAGVVLQVAAVVIGLARVHLGPVLQPGAGGVHRIAVAVGVFAEAVHVAVAAQLQVHRGRHRQQQIFVLAEAAGGEVEELRFGIPFLHHADDAEALAIHADVLADAVAALVQLVVQGLGDDHHACAAVVVLAGPGTAVLHRHVEHREEISRGPARIDRERLQGAAVRLDGAAAAAHQRLALGLGFAQQGFAIEAGHLRIGFLAGHVATAGARIELHVEQAIALVRDRIAGEHVEDGQGGHRGADAQRDGNHHQRGQDLVAAEAARRQSGVVGEHGRALTR